MIEREEVVRKILHDLANALGSSTMALDLLDLETAERDRGPDDLLHTARRGLKAAASHVADAAEAISTPERPIARVPALMERMAQIIEGINAYRPFDETLAELAVLMEAHIPGIRVAIFLQSAPATLQLRAAPSLPELFTPELDGLRIEAKGVGCAQSAACSKQQRTLDVTIDPAWGRRGTTAAQHDVPVCISQPIMAQDDGSLHGVIEVFCPQGWEPDVSALMILERYQRLIALAVQASSAQTSLLADEEQYRSIFDRSSTPMAVIDADARISQTNRALEDLAGLDDLDLVSSTIADLFEVAELTSRQIGSEASRHLALRNRRTGVSAVVSVAAYALPRRSGGKDTWCVEVEADELHSGPSARGTPSVIDLDDLDDRIES